MRSRSLLTLLAILSFSMGAPSAPALGAAAPIAAGRQASANWPTFRFDVSHSAFNRAEAVLGPPNVANLTLAWSATMTCSCSGVQADPVVVGRTLYETSIDGGVYAFDAITGALLWTASAGVGKLSSPAVAGGILYTGSIGGSLFALDAANGTLLWSFVTGGAIFSPPTVANGLVYFGSDDGNEYAIDAATGGLAWE